MRIPEVHSKSNGFLEHIRKVSGRLVGFQSSAQCAPCCKVCKLHALRRQSGFLLNSLIDRRDIDGVSRRSNRFEPHAQKHSQPAARQTLSGLARYWTRKSTESNCGETLFCLANSCLTRASLPSLMVALLCKPTPLKEDSRTKQLAKFISPGLSDEGTTSAWPRPSRR